MSKLNINVDSTVLGTSGCILNLYRNVIGSLDESGQSTGGYRESVTSDAIVYGVAVHKFVDVMYKTHGVYPKARKAAVELFTKIPKSINQKKLYLSDVKHLETTCFNLWSNYIEPESSFELLEVNQKCYLCKGEGIIDVVGVGVECPHCKGQKELVSAATELTFRIPYWEDEYIKIYLCGTIDSIGKFKNGCYAIRDWKTTSAWDNEGYFQQYELSRQLRIYLLALKLMSVYFPESTLGKLGATKMGAFIDAVFVKSKANENTYGRSEVFQLSPEELDAFQLTLDDKCEQLSRAVKTGYLPKEGILNGACQQQFNKCKFWDCCSHDSNIADVLLKRNFVQKQFNPLQYNEI